MRNAQLLAADKAHKALFSPTPGFEERTMARSGFSEKGLLNICVPHTAGAV